MIVGLDVAFGARETGGAQGGARARIEPMGMIIPLAWNDLDRGPWSVRSPGATPSCLTSGLERLVEQVIRGAA
jgi:hypothetical protein